MTARRPITIDSDNEMSDAPAPVRCRHNVDNFDPRAALGPDEVRDMIPHVQSRNAGTPIFNQHQMTLQELLCLTQILKSLQHRTEQPVAMLNFRSILEYSFNGWNTTHHVGHPPALAERKFNESRIQVGFLSQDHPLPAGKTRNGQQVRAARRAGQPVFFGVGLQYEDGTVDWAWRDKNNAGVSPRYVTLANGKTATSIRADAMVHFDMAEYDRIQVYNSRLVAYHLRCITKKWAEVGTAVKADIEMEDQPRGFAAVQLSIPIALEQGERLLEAAQIARNRMPTVHSPVF
ncbi:uncharacterized protein B0J16DRAFT_371951 [Fusarium flagelliforme]|uniref:uncharacterized protein n=1 Tax=Fusarium flagelliforme TaxID=2675880 RepID=UPI001E8CD9E2|nr:uncharacterized protein B0J16DRAFT_371951 [Fusarium flagelliforme]KAH7185100.1 hypothetical protein B0J16DRAFT_371951 [Fusarium flagelliforme]